jgi:exodeoxyribonuclease-3
MFKIASWNVNSLRVRLPHVLEWLKAEQPDVLALQETKVMDEDFPVMDFMEAGYNAVYSGQKTYNGVATISKRSASIVATGMPNMDDPQKRVLASIHDDILVLNLYVPNGSEVGSEKYAYKLDWLSHLCVYTRELLNNYSKCILLGDFNIAPGGEDVHDPVEWEGKVLCSEPERQAFNDLIKSGLTDCFRLFTGHTVSYSWWDYRAAGFRRNRGLRIDHILASNALSEGCKGCWIDVNPRKLERPSDHTPVVAEFSL